MDEIPVEVIDGPFAGFEAVLVSHEDDRVVVDVRVLGRRIPVDLHPGQVRVTGAGEHATSRDRIDAGPALPGAVREQPPGPTPEERLLAAIFGETPVDHAPAEHAEQAAERLERARMAAVDRDHELWEAGRTDEERRAGPARGNPGRYAYARAARTGVSLPGDGGVELAIRSATGTATGPIPVERVDGLRLDLRRLADLSPLALLPNLRWLTVSSTVPIDVAALASSLVPARSLSDLTIEAPIDDAGPLAGLTQVIRLKLDATLITDLSPLAGARHLRDLSVCDGPLRDLTPLAGLRLERLFVYRTRVSDLSPLAGMASLQVLGLAGCPVRDLEVVTTLPALHAVNLTRTGLTDLGDLPERAPLVTFEGVGPLPPAPPRVTRAARAADELVAEFRAAGDDWRARGQLARAMLAGRRLDLVRPLVAEGASVAGLLLPGGIGDVPFPDNPWHIPAGDTLAAALTRVWAPIAAYAPRFVAAVHARTLALALLRQDDGTAALAYLAWRRDDDGTGNLLPPPDSLDRFADPALDYHLSVLVGAAPQHADPAATVPLLAGPVPRPIRDFWAIHHILRPDHGDSVGGPLAVNTLEFFPADGWSTVSKRLGELAPDRFVHSAGRANYDDYLLDLDLLDAAGNPTVATWAFKEWKVGGHLQYWDWLDGTGAGLLFGP
ncbi:hypothetical protein OIE66_16565 [Nonomuraea sp. NBC_01738]|uniref:hypothetical protein n=1 Tax=Nonomuraea sp. NBC_01738 TaxID=2976003 RepID=UPI002E0DE606|nr:hypothetical protein OIE66_16565 [Nonomuraea sp. NBC_01738]